MIRGSVKGSMAGSFRDSIEAHLRLSTPKERTCTLPAIFIVLG